MDVGDSFTLPERVSKHPIIVMVVYRWGHLDGKAFFRETLVEMGGGAHFHIDDKDMVFSFTGTEAVTVTLVSNTYHGAPYVKVCGIG